MSVYAVLCCSPVVLSSLSDEEIGGEMGMGRFIKSELFKSWNVGFALDEGIASDTGA